MVTGKPRIDDSRRALNILYSFPHTIGDSGIGVTAWNQVSNLIAAGHHVTLVATSVSRPLPGLARTVETLVVGGVRVPHRVINRTLAFEWHDLFASRVLKKGAFDVVHTWPLSATHTLRAAAALGVAGLREAPNTHTGHAYRVVAAEYASLGLEVPEIAHKFNAGKLRREQREWDLATGVLVPSEFVAETFIAEGVPAQKLLRHQYGVNPADIRAVPATKPDRPFTAIFVGRADPRKGLHYALEAWKEAASKHPTARLRIYGSFEEQYRRHLAPLLDSKTVEIMGFTADMAGVYADADVMMLPTLEEGSALVTYEAQSSGVVPLVSRVAGAVLEHNVHGLVHEPRDVATLTAQLCQLMDDPTTLARMRAACLAHAPELSWAAAGEILVARYREAMNVRATTPITAH